MMDWLQFIASVIGSMTWPMALLVIILTFRDEVERMLKQAKKLGAGGISLELSERVAAARDAADEVRGEQKEDTEASGLDTTMLKMAKTFPEAAVVQAYRELERVAHQLKACLGDEKSQRTYEIIQTLRGKGEITDSVVKLFERLREAKNTAAHAKGNNALTPAEAVELVEQSQMLTELLQRILRRMSPAKPEFEKASRGNPD
jgi:hypothetical protein